MSLKPGQAAALALVMIIAGVAILMLDTEQSFTDKVFAGGLCVGGLAFGVSAAMSFRRR